MTAEKSAAAAPRQLEGFGAGSVVKLDGGRRIRLDDIVDFWPATGAWQALPSGVDGDRPRSAGVGMASMLAFLKLERERAGQPLRVPAPLPSARRIRCDHCDGPAQLQPGSVVYPDRDDLAERQFWVCWPCDAWVGCHNGTDKPFGPLARLELRQARHAAHRAFDAVWQGGHMERSAAYDWLARELEVPRHRCHIGMLSLEDCRRVRHLVWDRFGAVGDAE